jgi:ABC-type multidrug transport system ATPase subunit
MKLKSLFVDDHKILKKLNINFSEEKEASISVLIGENGAGKTTVFEAILEIFSCLLFDLKSKFTFSLEYSITRNEISLDSTSWGTSNSVNFNVKIEGMIDNPLLMSVVLPNGKILGSISEINNDVALSRLYSHLPSNIYKVIPENIVVYYSGTSDVLKNVVIKHIDQFKSNSKKGITNIPQVLFYYEPTLFKIVLLSLLSYEYGDIPTFLKEKAKIDQLLRVKLFFKRPSGSNAKLIDQWNTQGQAKLLFDFLDEKREVWNTDKRGQLETNFNVTLNSHEYVFQLKDLFREERELFNVFYALYVDDYLEDIEFQFANGDTVFNNLSEGEQQSITIRGLIELLSEENSLFLYDEPDTYLHPKWQQDFLGEIYQFNKSNLNQEANFLITTHSPMLLSTFKNGDIFSLQNGKSIIFKESTYGKEINTILKQTMNSLTRVKEIDDKVIEIQKFINENRLDAAKELIQELGKMMYDADDEQIIRLLSIIKRKEIIGR